MKNVKKFEAELSKVKRPGMDKLLEFIRTSDFYQAPSSTRFHLASPGGLLQHSLNVLDAFRDILKKNDDGDYEYRVVGKPVATVPEDSVIIMALLHDICKTFYYKLSYRNKKIDGQWQQVPWYERDDKIPYGHGEKSVMMLTDFIALTKEEKYAIRWHMGFTEGDINTFGKAVEMYPIIWALHNADMVASKFMEGAEQNNPAFS